MSNYKAWSNLLPFLNILTLCCAAKKWKFHFYTPQFDFWLVSKLIKVPKVTGLTTSNSTNYILNSFHLPLLYLHWLLRRTKSIFPFDWLRARRNNSSRDLGRFGCSSGPTFPPQLTLPTHGSNYRVYTTIKGVLRAFGNRLFFLKSSLVSKFE